MRYVIAIDSFKGSLTSLEAGSAVREAILDLEQKNEVVVLPLADGGEGTVEAMYSGLGGTLVEVSVTGPLQEKVNAKYCILPDGKTAVIEMAYAAGLTLVPENKRNPLKTTTYGVGEIIKDAINRGCRKFIVGIGGSATNDGGTGMLSALGYKFLDENGDEIPLGAKGLEKLKSISSTEVIPELENCSFRVACDVTNPLCGEFGCSAVFAPQKGATNEDITKMDLWLKNYADITKTLFPESDSQYPGTGAAGGLGFAFHSFLNGELKSGVSIILQEIGFEKYVLNADVVITGEGRLDAQTAMGKAPVGVAKIAKKYDKKVIAFAGSVSDGAEILREQGIDEFYGITPSEMPLEIAMKKDVAYKNLYNTVQKVMFEKASV